MKLKVILSVMVILLGGFVFVLLPSETGDDAGDIHIEVIDADGQTVLTETLSFDADDSLYDVLNRHIEIETRGTSGGRILLSIAGLSTDFVHNFIKIEIDGELSRSGIDQTNLKDGSVYTFSVDSVR